MATELHFEPIKQEAWYKQVSEDMNESKRIIDGMSLTEIYQLYKEKQFVCDTCGKQISNIHTKSTEEHIMHLIDPTCHWVCGTCTDDDLKNNRVIAMDL